MVQQPPMLTDYIGLIMHLFEQFMQHRIEKQGIKPAKAPTYSIHSFIIFFMWIQFHRIYAFKTQWRWLTHHPEMLKQLGWQQTPHRTTDLFFAFRLCSIFLNAALALRASKVSSSLSKPRSLCSR